nr:MAG TPA: hypothetical protein [Caudoviricetes sp.]
MVGEHPTTLPFLVAFYRLNTLLVVPFWHLYKQCLYFN